MSEASTTSAPDTQRTFGLSIETVQDESGKSQHFIGLYGVQPNVVRCFPFTTAREMVDKLTLIKQKLNVGEIPHPDDVAFSNHQEIASSEDDKEFQKDVILKPSQPSAVRSSKEPVPSDGLDVGTGEQIHIAVDDDIEVEGEIWSDAASVLRGSLHASGPKGDKEGEGVFSLPSSQILPSWRPSQAARSALQKWYNEDNSALRQALESDGAKKEPFAVLYAASDQEIFDQIFTDLMSSPEHREAYAAFENSLACMKQTSAESQSGPSASAQK